MTDTRLAKHVTAADASQESIHPAGLSIRITPAYSILSVVFSLGHQAN